MDAHIIAKWINILISLIIPAFFIKLYFTPSMAFFYKKKWVIVASSILILCTIVQNIDTLIIGNKNRLPAKEELQRKIAANNTLVDQDFLYTSSDGYSLIVPTGYAYTTFPSGAISMTAFKNLLPSSMQSGITVSRRQVSEELEYLMTDAMKILKSGNPSYTFHSILKFSINNQKAFKVSVEVQKEGVPIKGVFVFTKTGNKFLGFNMSCPASFFPQESKAFDKVVQSIDFR